MIRPPNPFSPSRVAAALVCQVANIVQPHSSRRPFRLTVPSPFFLGIELTENQCQGVSVLGSVSSSKAVLRSIKQFQTKSLVSDLQEHFLLNRVRLQAGHGDSTSEPNGQQQTAARAHATRVVGLSTFGQC